LEYWAVGKGKEVI